MHTHIVLVFVRSSQCEPSPRATLVCFQAVQGESIYVFRWMTPSFHPSDLCLRPSVRSAWPVGDAATQSKRCENYCRVFYRHLLQGPENLRSVASAPKMPFPDSPICLLAARIKRQQAPACTALIDVLRALSTVQTRLLAAYLRFARWPRVSYERVATVLATCLPNSGKPTALRRSHVENRWPVQLKQAEWERCSASNFSTSLSVRVKSVTSAHSTTF